MSRLVLGLDPEQAIRITTPEGRVIVLRLGDCVHGIQRLAIEADREVRISREASSRVKWPQLTGKG